VALSLALNVMVAMLLVPPMGYVGACVATILAESFVFGVGLVLLKRYAHYTLAPAGIWKPLLAASTMVGIAYVGRSWDPVVQLVLLPLAVVSYAAGLVLLGELTANELSTVRSTLSGMLKPRLR
jgi:O-antigen/teichoic acid export membrane protein